MRMTKRLAILFLLATGSLQAQPWFKDWKSWAVIGASIGSSLAATHNAHDCRTKFGPAPCDGGYGEFKAREIARGVTSIGMTSISLWGRHQHFKEWSLPALGFAGYNASVAYRQTQKGCPAGEEYVYGTKFSCTAADTWQLRTR
jgi:hypothetical protein